MRVLRALFGRVIIGFFGKVLVAVIFADIFARGGNGGARYARGVRSYISYKRDFALVRQFNALVKRLRGGRRLAQTHAEFVHCVLLHCGRDKRRVRVRFRHALFDVFNRILRVFEVGHQFFNVVFARQFNLFALVPVERGFNIFAAFGF